MRIILLFLFSFSKIFAQDFQTQSIQLQDVLVKDKQLPEGQNVAEQRDFNTRLNTNASVSAAGGTGSTNMTTPVSIRGLDSKHTVVTLDGVLLKDPAATDSRANFSILAGMPQGQISILPGHEGALISSQSVAGLISIETEDELRPFVLMGHGLEREVGWGHQWANNNTKFLFSVSMAESTDLVQSHAKNGNEKDSYQYQNVDVKLLHAFSDSTVTETYLKRYQNRMELDPLPYTDGKDDGSSLRMNLINHKTAWALLNGATMWHRISWHQFDREQFSAYGTFNFDADSTQNQIGWESANQNYHIDWYVDQDRFETDQFSSKSSTLSELNLTGKFPHQHWPIFVKAGLVSHSTFAQRANFLTGVSYRLNENTEFGVSASTSYSPPSLYHLYGPDITDGLSCKSGNEDLSPEVGVNQEAWLVHKSNSVEWSAKLYGQRVLNYISHNCQQGYNNEEEMLGSGHEVGWKKAFGATRMGLSYGKFDSKISNDMPLLRRPDRKMSLFAQYNLSDQHLLVAVYNWVGELYDSRPDGELEQMGNKGLLDLGWDYQHGNYGLKTLISNVANEDDSFIYGFSGKRRWFQLRLFYYY